MDASFQQLRSAKRRGLLGAKPMWHQYAPVCEADLLRLANQRRVPLPDQLIAFLSEFGFGEINDELSFRYEWLKLVEDGPLAGHLIFGQDEQGSFYTVGPLSGAVHYLSRSGLGCCKLSSSFNEFLREAAAHGFRIVEWVESQPLLPSVSAA